MTSNFKNKVDSYLSSEVGRLFIRYRTYVDGIATFKEQEYPFELFCNGTKVSGSLQEYLLMEIEEEQS